MNNLKNIYRDLSQGKLTQQQALEKIKAIKLMQKTPGGVLLATPVWESELSAVLLASNNDVIKFKQHHILLCEIPDVNATQLGTLISANQILLLTSRNKNIAVRYNDFVLACFEFIQTILKSRPAGQVLVQIVAINKQSSMILTGLSGLLKTTMLENPELIAQIIFTTTLDFSQSSDAIEKLAGQLQRDRSRPQDTIIKYEKGARKVLRWREIVTAEEVPAKTINEAVAFKNDGAYLITGGLGGLGILLTREILLQTSNSKIILTGRSELTAKKQSIMKGFSEQENPIDNRVAYYQLDIENSEQVELLVTSIKEKYQQLNGIIHCAGMTADNFIIKKSSAEFRDVLGPKVSGTYHLDQASRDLDLDFFALFSSAASWLGNIGQADYAAANGFLDQFSARRNQQVAKGERKGKTISINWSLWQDGGMSIEQTSLDAIQKNTGATQLQTARGMQAFYRSLQSPHNQLSVTEGDLSKMRVTLLEEPVHQMRSANNQKPIVDKKPSTNKTTQANQSRDLQDSMRDYLCKQFSKLLKLPSHRIDPQAPMEKYGIDSITAMSLTTQLEKTFGSLPKTLFFEYQTIAELADYFVHTHSAKITSLSIKAEAGNKNINEQLTLIDRQTNSTQNLQALKNKLAKPNLDRRFSRQRHSTVLSNSAESNHTQLTNPPKKGHIDPIAIIGLSGRYPEAVNIEEYWHNLRDGKDCIVEVPKERWDWRQYYSEDRAHKGRHFSKWGGFIVGVDEFDPRFFNISPREAKSIDPQERLFLQHAYMAVEDAGYTRTTLQIPHQQDAPGQVGVYVGVMYGEYNVSGSLASIANRVSYVLNLHGPSMTLDTMCSSSLTAIHLACQDLKQGRTDLAIAGGVNVSIHPSKYQMLSSEQFISSTGHCQSFGEGGDGYIPSEGVGAVILKRLPQAEQDGNHIYGVIKGSALNHGGKTNGYSVPNPGAQTNAISRALAESNIDPRRISYIEAHGTGTKLGDPIEIAALTKAFNHYTPSLSEKSGFCLLGSAKSNLGHCESAAGIAGVTKVLLQMKYQQIAPSLHSTKLNPHIDFDKTPFTVNQSLKTWDASVVDGKEVPRVAGVSSFGAGGSNAHIIIEEYPTIDIRITEDQNIENQSIDTWSVKVIVLSARTEQQLEQKCLDLFEFISRQKSAIDLEAMAYTLQVGREAMGERLAFMVNSIEQLSEKLNAYLRGEIDIEDAYRGKVKNHKETLSLFSTDADIQQTLDKWIADRKLSKLLDLWVKGLALDWNKLYELDFYDGIKPKLISLPTYPFAKDKYWIDPMEMGGILISDDSVSEIIKPLHPVLHTNTSDLFQQSYHSIFSGKEFFLKTDFANQLQNRQQVLPTAVYLEMARAAIENAMPDTKEAFVVELHDTIWAQPIVVEGNTSVSLALLAKDHEHIDFEIYTQDQAEQKDQMLTQLDTVHCQGHAVLSRLPAPEKLDVVQLISQLLKHETSSSHQVFSSIYVGDNQLLAQLNMGGRDRYSADYILHPTLIDLMLQAFLKLIKGESQTVQHSMLPYSLTSIRFIFAYTQNMFAWLRYSPEQDGINAKFDIDWCDGHGNVCIQIKGLHYQSAIQKAEQLSEQIPIVEKALVQNTTVLKKTSTEKPVPRKIVLDKINNDYVQVKSQKPTSISLTSVDAFVAKNIFDSEKFHGSERSDVRDDILKSPPVTLSNIIFFDKKVDFPSDENKLSQAVVDLYDNGNGIFSIQINNSINNTLSEKLITKLLVTLEAVKEESHIKVLIINGSDKHFLNGLAESHNLAIAQKLYQVLIEFPYPVIAVMKGSATGAGFIIGALCDFMICSEEANYRYADTQANFFPGATEEKLFNERFGEVAAQDFLHQSTQMTGEQLQAKEWSCPVLPKSKVDAYAYNLAADLASKPQEALKLLKSHLARHLVQHVRELTAVVVSLDEETQRSINKLKSKTKPKITSPVKYIQLVVHTDNILIIKIGTANKKYSVKTLLRHLTKIFDQVNKKTYYKSIILVSGHADFLPEVEQSNLTKLLEGFQQLLLNSSVPVIATLDTNANAFALTVSQFCDACIYNKQGNFSVENIWHTPKLLKIAAMIFAHQFGEYSAKEILLAQNNYSGLELQHKQAKLICVDQNQVFNRALQLAELWSEKSLSALTSWKKRTSKNIWKKINRLPIWPEPKKIMTAPLANKPTLIKLQSKVISATAHQQGILVVKVEDRQAKNMFSDAFVEGMNEVFAHIEQTPAYQVVVLTGYDSYFSSGGTKESLLDIQQGKSKFTDTQTFQMAMKCHLPVIAAMQGHGIGAGWALGLFADFVLLSEESHYVSPYMNYGFTPGAAATFISPLRMGYDLARESLLTAQEYDGKELRNKGLQLPVLPRQKVVPAAINLAKQIARHPRNLLIALKHHWTEPLRDLLQQTCELELAMHEKTFVGQSNILERIQNNFLNQANPQKEVIQKIEQNAIDLNNGQQPESMELNKNLVNLTQSATISAITATIKKLLAGELHMNVAEVEEDIQFVDLGLDSITGVTWVRKINEKYHISIEATKVYSFPTLAEFAQLVKTEIEKQVAPCSQPGSELQTSSKTSDTSNAAVGVVSVAKTQQADTTISNAVPKTETAMQFGAVAGLENIPAITATLKKLLADELHMSVAEIDEDAQFVDLGLDSITGVTWVRKINDKYQLSIEATKVYSYPTVKEFSAYVKAESAKQGRVIDEELSGEKLSEDSLSEGNLSITDSQLKNSPLNNPLLNNFQFTTSQFASSQTAVKRLTSWRQSASKIRTKTQSNFQLQPIAVISMAGQFPQANNLEEFWNNIALAKNCITPIPSQRWDLNNYYQEGAPTAGKTNSQWVGAMEEYDLFDPLFFTISPTEAESMEPQQRVFLQACWHTIENAGYDAQSLSGSKCGVFVGCAAGDYNLISREQQISAQGFTGGATSILAARISYFLNLQGPCLSIDTACSSSLVAIVNACDSLNTASSDLALAGGVYVMAGPDMHIKSAQAGMLSTDGRCFAFDQRANGFVPGEGVGVVMLKRLADAEKDQDIIQGVIQGWGINQDGKTNGITAPNADSQTRLQQEVYDKFQIDPANIQLIEAHGTGTKLGDPIEVAGLKESFKKYTQKKYYCALGSVKSNIGHCLTAAAVAGFIKLILAMKHKQLPPTINFQKLNEHISLEDSPFYINDQLQDWKVGDTESRQAAISSFGFSGTNAHMVIAEYIAPMTISNQSVVVTENGKVIIPLSARNAEQLIQVANNLLEFIAKQNQSIDLIEMSYTLQVGREAMDERVGFMVDSIEQLEEKLQTFVNNGQVNGIENIDDTYRGQVRSDKESMRIISQDDEMKETIVQNWMASRKLSKLLDLWVKGLALDWNKLYGDCKPQRISLPTYPFAKERYWIKNDVNESDSSKILTSVLHPLLHTKTEELSQQGYRSTFTNGETSQVNMNRPKVQRVSLPTYPFAKERCWVDVSVKKQNIEKKLKSDKLKEVKDFEFIENIINKVDDDSMETNQAVRLLKNLA